MKRTCLVLLSVLLLLCSCSKNEKEKNENVEKTEKTEKYIIPESWLRFSGMTPEESLESLLKLGEDYYTDAIVSGNNLELMLTDRQRDNHIKRNDEYLNEIVATVSEANSLYRCVLDENYQKFEIHMDEKMSTYLQVTTLGMFALCYGQNYMFKNKTSEWSVDISIYNCHTGKLVISMTVPTDLGSWGDKEWEASYND